MILYLTYNDQPSGVYWSQVTDVVEHMNTLGGPKVKLVALVSGRDFLKTRKVIKTHSPRALVLPMVPTMKQWKKNTALLAGVCALLRPTGIMCRGPLATTMALRMRERGHVKKVCFDGRGAYAAEWEEYRIIDDDALIAQFRPLEKEAVNESDFRLAVSNALVAHWRERYAYRGDRHVVIPCTLGTSRFSTPRSDTSGLRPTPPALLEVTEPKAPRTGVRLVYSGSTAGWQSFELLKDMLTKVLDAQPEVDVMFLSKRDANNGTLEAAYPGRVEVKWLAHEQVQDALNACDYGIMVREDTITNRVASPTKFAEYLRSGLRIIASEGLGDFSDLVKEERLGVVLDKSSTVPRLEPTPGEERIRLKALAEARFTKGAYDGEYRALLRALS